LDFDKLVDNFKKAKKTLDENYKPTLNLEQRRIRTMYSTLEFLLEGTGIDLDVLEHVEGKESLEIKNKELYKENIQLTRQLENLKQYCSYYLSEKEPPNKVYLTGGINELIDQYVNEDEAGLIIKKHIKEIREMM